MEKIFRNNDGTIISKVLSLTPQLVTETLFKGRPNAEAVILYLDGENSRTIGPERPCLWIKFAADGKTIVSISLTNDPQGANFHWQR